jgi:hypothetical protein
VLVNRDLFGRSVRATVHRWLPFITNSPVPRRPLLIATALTAAAAVAAGGSTTALESPQPDQIVTVPAAGAASGSTAAAAPAEPGRAATGGSAASGSAAERAAKVAAAREKASRAKADRAQALAPGRSVPDTKRPSSANGSDKANNGGKANGATKKNPAPSGRELLPNGTPGGQSAFAPSREQVRNAKQIVRTGERLNMPPRAQVIAVATALQESKLENLGHLGARNDHDSLGLFQQRPSSGWGTPDQVTNPDYAAEQFYRGLARIPGYQDLPLTAAAQAVQVSAFPDAYAQWEKMAADLVLAAHGTGPYAGLDDQRN